jgi:hypothetical protein
MVNDSGTKFARASVFAYDVFWRRQHGDSRRLWYVLYRLTTELFGNFFVRQPPIIQQPTILLRDSSQLTTSNGLSSRPPTPTPPTPVARFPRL